MATLSLALFRNAESITYCVKPNESSQCLFNGCHNQPCKTWGYYVKYIEELTNQYTNVTMIFINGIHKAKYSFPIKIKSSAFTMMGESQKVTIQNLYSDIYFINNIQVMIKNLTFDKTYFSVSPTEPIEIIYVQFESVNLTYSEVDAYIEVYAKLQMRFTSCNFYDGSSVFGTVDVNFTDCELVNYTLTLAGAPLQEYRK